MFILKNRQSRSFTTSLRQHNTDPVRPAMRTEPRRRRRRLPHVRRLRGRRERRRRRLRPVLVLDLVLDNRVVSATIGRRVRQRPDNLIRGCGWRRLRATTATAADHADHVSADATARPAAAAAAAATAADDEPVELCGRVRIRRSSAHWSCWLRSTASAATVRSLSAASDDWRYGFQSESNECRISETLLIIIPIQPPSFNTHTYILLFNKQKYSKKNFFLIQFFFSKLFCCVII